MEYLIKLHKSFLDLTIVEMSKELKIEGYHLEIVYKRIQKLKEYNINNDIWYYNKAIYEMTSSGLVLTNSGTFYNKHNIRKIIFLTEENKPNKPFENEEEVIKHFNLDKDVKISKYYNKFIYDNEHCLHVGFGKNKKVAMFYNPKPINPFK